MEIIWIKSFSFIQTLQIIKSFTTLICAAESKPIITKVQTGNVGKRKNSNGIPLFVDDHKMLNASVNAVNFVWFQT